MEDTNSVLTKQVEQLKRENQELKRQALQYRMSQAISDDQLSQHMLQELDNYFPHDRTPWFLCILFHGEKSHKQFPEKRPMELIEEAFQGVLSEFGIPFFFETIGTVVCLLNVALPSAHPNPKQCFAGLCGTIRTALTEKHTSTVSQTNLSHISMSRISSMEGGPRLLYRSAVAVSEHRTRNSDVVCMAYDLKDMTAASPNRAFSLELEFWRHIQKRSFFSAAVALDQLIDATSFQQGSLERTLASVFSRMELVMTIVAQDQDSVVQTNSALSQLLPELSQANTFQEMREVSYDILATLEDLFCTPADGRNKKMPAIERFIQQNYTDQNLGAASISEEFRISTSYLSRIFRMDTGMGVVDYIHQVRIDAARKLLVTTDLSMEDIAVQSGFSNRWGFLRVFKELEGTTPGSYRLQNKA